MGFCAATVSAAVTSAFSDGVLTVSSDADDDITITAVAGSVAINGGPPGSGTVDASQVTEIEVNGGPGANRIDLTGITVSNGFDVENLEADLFGNEGNDEILTGESSSFIMGGAGHDTIMGGSGADEIRWFLGDGQDTIDGGDGASDDFDFVMGSSPNSFEAVDGQVESPSSPIEISLPTHPGNSVAVSRMETIDFFGTRGANELTFQNLAGTDTTGLRFFPRDGADVIDASLAGRPVIVNVQGRNFDTTFSGSEVSGDVFEYQLNVSSHADYTLSADSGDVLFTRTASSQSGMARLVGVEEVYIRSGRGSDSFLIENLDGTDLESAIAIGALNSDTFSVFASSDVELTLQGDGSSPEDPGVVDELLVDVEMLPVFSIPGQINIAGRLPIIHSGFESVVLTNQDTVSPTVVSIESDTAAITNAADITFTVTFSEAVAGFDGNEDIELVESGVTHQGAAISGADDTWEVFVDGIDGNGTLALRILPQNEGSNTMDLQGNPVLSAAASSIITIDTTHPIPVLTGPGEVGDLDPFTVNLVFSEDVAEPVEEDFEVEGATIDDIDRDGIEEYILTLAPDEPGTLVLRLPANSVTDAAGNGNIASNQYTRLVGVPGNVWVFD